MRGQSLARYLGYRARPGDPAHRLARDVAASRPVSWVLARTLRQADGGLAAISGGRVSGPGLLAGAPVVRLTTFGSRTGRRREVRLVPVVTPDVFAVLGTNFGGRRTPGWVHNLLADPRADLAYRRRAVSVRARDLCGEERAAVLVAASAVYPAFVRYEARAIHRHVHVFALEATATGDRV